MSIDYRLLHHFRVSQRRELAARGALPDQWRWQDEEDETDLGSPHPLREATGPLRHAKLVQLLSDDR